MRKAIVLILLLAPMGLSAQDAARAWTLRECIDYAVENNISVRQIKLRADNRELELNTSRNSRLPDIGASLGERVSFGRGSGRDGVMQDNTTLSTSFGVDAGMTLFSGMRINNDIRARMFDHRAALHDLDKAREDVALNVTALYLQVLLNRELMAVAESQVSLSGDQVRRSEYLVGSGKSPESELYENKAAYARDEYSLTTASNNVALALLDLGQALNLPSAKGFDVMDPDLSGLAIERLDSMENPDSVYTYALGTRPGLRAERERLKSAESALKRAQGARYPSVTLGAGYNNGYYHTYADNVVNSNFRTQIKNNGNEYVGLSVNIPIFNRMATRNGIRAARLNILSQQYAIRESEQTLRKEIERSYYNADAALLQYESATKSLDAATEAMKYEEEKSSVGRSTTYDYNEARMRMQRAESDLAQAKYEYIFRRKILDFYLGLPLDFGSY